jgi:hypothetical protein
MTVKDEMYGVQLINTSDINVFAPIKKSESFTESRNLTGYAIEVEKPDGSWKMAGSVSRQYLLIDNREIIERGLEILEKTGLATTHKRLWSNGKAFKSTWTIDDLTIDIAKSYGVDTGVSEDKFSAGFHVLNSYDGSWAAQAGIHIERQVCSNGMMAKQILGGFKFKHLNGNADWKGNMDACLQMIENSERSMGEVLASIAKLTQLEVNTKNLTLLRSRKNNPITDGKFGRILGDYLKGSKKAGAEHRSMYGLYNAGTHQLWCNDGLTAGDISNNETWGKDFLNLVEVK